MIFGYFGRGGRNKGYTCFRIFSCGPSYGCYSTFKFLENFIFFCSVLTKMSILDSQKVGCDGDLKKTASSQEKIEVHISIFSWMLVRFYICCMRIHLTVS